MRLRSPRILPNPFRVLKDVRDGRLTRIPPRVP